MAPRYACVEPRDVLSWAPLGRVPRVHIRWSTSPSLQTPVAQSSYRRLHVDEHRDWETNRLVLPSLRPVGGAALCGFDHATVPVAPIGTRRIPAFEEIFAKPRDA